MILPLPEEVPVEWFKTSKTYKFAGGDIYILGVYNFLYKDDKLYNFKTTWNQLKSFWWRIFFSI